jgi:8-oxo-dGTP pyrophosphatase MutT (NUDIX family)
MVSPPEMITFDCIARILARHEPAAIESPSRTRAAVALILRIGVNGLEALLMERASREGDPWSGDIGLPGGRGEDQDRSPRQTAERETYEEIGLDLTQCRYLGRLSDIIGAHLPVLVSCYVYGAVMHNRFDLNHEVRDLIWVSLSDLNAPARHITATVRFGGEEFIRPAIRLPQAGKPLLWGLTYRFVMEFLGILASAEKDIPD